MPDKFFFFFLLIQYWLTQPTRLSFRVPRTEYTYNSLQSTEYSPFFKEPHPSSIYFDLNLGTVLYIVSQTSQPPRPPSFLTVTSGQANSHVDVQIDSQITTTRLNQTKPDYVTDQPDNNRSPITEVSLYYIFY